MGRGQKWGGSKNGEGTKMKDGRKNRSGVVVLEADRRVVLGGWENGTRVMSRKVGG